MSETRIEKNKEKVKEIQKEERIKKEKKIGNIFLKVFLPIFGVLVVIYILLRFVGNMGLIVKEYPIYNDNLPSDFNGVKIVQFSDLHFNDQYPIDNVKKLVKMINNTNPDIVVFTGDLIDSDHKISNKTKEELMKEFNKIEAKLGKYAIKGEEDSTNFEDIFNNSNFTILNNSIINVYINSSVINIIAVDDTYSYSDLPKINDYYSIALIHEPDLADRVIDDYNPELILAGHSHNGQIILPFIGPVMRKEGAKKYIDSHYTIKNTELYISGGLGNSNYNFRLFNHPSINFFRLRNSK